MEQRLCIFIPCAGFHCFLPRASSKHLYVGVKYIYTVSTGVALTINLLIHGNRNCKTTGHSA